MQVAGGTRQAFAQSIEKGEGTCTERTVGFFIIIVILYYYYYFTLGRYVPEGV